MKSGPSTSMVALFRGINVGGKHIVPMAELKGLLTDMGLQNVRSYIQSGNVVFATRATAGLAPQIASAVEERFGFRPAVLLLTASELEQAANGNPFTDAEANRLHFFFLEREPESPRLDQLESLKIRSESFHLGGRVFYLHAPAGIGRSKLAARAEKCLGVPATGRNLRTVTKLIALSNTAHSDTD